MFDKEIKIELVKLNIAIFGAVVSAIKLGVEYYEYHIVTGAILVGITAFLQYLSLLPEFAVLPNDSSKEDIKSRDKRANEWYVILGSSSYIFLVFGFVYPHSFPGSTIGAAVPFVVAIALFLGWPLTLHHHPTRDLSSIDRYMIILMMILVGILSFGVIGVL